MAEAKLIELAGMKDGKLVVLENNLYKLLTRQELQGKPLVIISMVGVSRAGKSFFMNFFVRYLKNQGWRNSNWFGDDNTVVCGGQCLKPSDARGGQSREPSDDVGGKALVKWFPQKLLDAAARRVPSFIWKRGEDACTQGILVYPEVFCLPLQDNRQAAVLLVDTQGLFDDETSPDTNSRIMSLSLLFSSHVILNIMRQIQARDYEHIEVCIRLTKAIANITCGEESRAFQKLTLLVRDFELDENYGNGSEYLHRSLNKQTASKEVQNMKDEVKQAFHGVGCFLLPRPGKKVTRPSDSEIANKSLKDVFREYAKQFVETILDPKNLTVKTIGESEAQASDLLHLLGRVGQAYKKGEAPSIGTLSQSAVQGNNTNALQRAVAIYRETMNSKFENTLDALKEKHKQGLEKADELFHTISKLGNKNDRNDFWRQCKMECQDVFDNLEDKIRRNKRQKEFQTADSLMLALAEDYKTSMGKYLHGTLDTFEGEHNKRVEETLQKFDDETKQFDEIIDEVKIWRKLLHDQMASFYGKVKFEREKEIQKTATSKLDDLLDSFTRKLDPYTMDYQEDFEILLEATRNDALKQCKNLLREAGKHPIIQCSKKKFEKDLERLLSNASKINGERKTLLKKKFYEAGEQYADILDESLSKFMKTAYINPDFLDTYVENYWLEEVLPSLYGKPKWVQIFIKETFGTKADEIKKRNKRNQKFRSVEIDNFGFWARFKVRIHEITQWIGRLLGMKKTDVGEGNGKAAKEEEKEADEGEKMQKRDEEKGSAYRRGKEKGE